MAQRIFAESFGAVRLEEPQVSLLLKTSHSIVTRIYCVLFKNNWGNSESPDLKFGTLYYLEPGDGSIKS